MKELNIIEGSEVDDLLELTDCTHPMYLKEVALMFEEFDSGSGQGAEAGDGACVVVVVVVVVVVPAPPIELVVVVCLFVCCLLFVCLLFVCLLFVVCCLLLCKQHEALILMFFYILCVFGSFYFCKYIHTGVLSYSELRNGLGKLFAEANKPHLSKSK